jgi:hypothetical protein
MFSGPSPDNPLSAPAVVILGADAVLAALPATAVQLAHACLAAGYTAAFPASWGDELVAEGCIRRLVSRGAEPAIMCSCPLVADRLLGSELTPMLVPLVAPPVACARYLRAVYAPTELHITYIGSCPSAADPALDARLSPVEFLARLGALGIAVDEQPLFFESVLPPDRRRFYSLPGGVPAPDWLAAGGAAPRSLVEVDGDDYRPQLAERLLAREPVLLDVAPHFGCVCSGAGGRTPASDARSAVAALEPPRSAGDIVDARVHVDIDRPVPVACLDAEGEGASAAAAVGESTAVPVSPNGARRDAEYEDAVPERGACARNHRTRPAATRRGLRRATVRTPVARATDGHVLPRAYLAHHRPHVEHVLPLELADMAPAEIADQLFCEPATPATPFRSWASLPRAVADPLTP